MSDLISRQDVPDTNVGDMIRRQEILRAFEEMCSCTDYGWDERDFRDLIKKMPSAEPKRKRGRWIDFCGSYQCSCCNMTNAYEDNFCPNCGADMRRGEQK